MTAPRALAFLALAWATLVVQAALGALIPWHGAAPELTLLIVLYLGFYGRGAPTAFAGLALTIGYFTDLFAASPRGLHALTLGLVMLAARAASNRLLVANVWQVLVVTLASAIGHGALVVALTSSMYGGDATRALWLVPWTAAATCVAAPFVFALLRRLDRKLAPDPRMRIAV